ncbi:MAG: DMT family transporter [Betaproteobacteria bacterium]|nr:DMT family transporter [Betaproteobacteria bacterium]
MPSRSLRDWALLLSLVAMWGSAFMFIKIAVVTVPPATVAAGRLMIGALILVAVVYARGLHLPPPGRAWIPLAALAVVGNAVPFYLIAWGQKTIDSALAGILIAVMPLATLVLAHYFVHGEKTTRNRLIGFVLGFIGIVILMGPAALSGVAGSAGEIVAQLAVLSGALCYAANSVLARRTVKGNVLVSSAGVLLLASVVALPFALILDRPWTLAPGFSSAAAVIWLGVGATAIPTLCYFALIGSAGPTFMSLVNYLSPCVALALGVAIHGEEPGPNAYAGLALILSAIGLSQVRRRPPSVS